MILELELRNHPGAMSHVTGLFSRRAFNLEAIFCVPNPGTETSLLLLEVNEEPRLEQIEKQLARLEDVRKVTARPDLPVDYLRQLRQAVGP